jgi:hypothetical protein
MGKRPSECAAEEDGKLALLSAFRMATMKPKVCVFETFGPIDGFFLTLPVTSRRLPR